MLVFHEALLRCMSNRLEVEVEVEVKVVLRRCPHLRQGALRLGQLRRGGGFGGHAARPVAAFLRQQLPAARLHDGLLLRSRCLHLLRATPPGGAFTK